MDTMAKGVFWAIRVALSTGAGIALLGAAACGPKPVATTEPATPTATTTVPTATWQPTEPMPTLTSTTGRPPRGGISIKQLTAAPIDVPQWTDVSTDVERICPDGRIRIGAADERSTVEPSRIQVWAVAYGNVDTDPAVETVALLGCVVGEPTLSQAVAFEPGTGGRIVTVGKVAQGWLWAVAVDSGRVRLDVSDMQACCGTPKAWELHQVRTYAWNGSAFRQVAGPTAFSTHAEPTDLKLTLVAASWQPVRDGKRSGEITVRVSNAGPYDSNEFLLWSDEATPDPIRYAPLPAGTSRTITVTAVLDAGLTDPAEVTLKELGTRDATPQDNWVSVPVPA